MSEPTKDTLRKEINAILKDADLSEMSAKKVRLQLEEKLDCDLSSRKKEVDELVMEFVNSKDEEDEEDSGEDSEEEEEKTKKGKRASAGRGGPAKKKKKGSSDESEDDNDQGSDEEYKPEKGSGSKKAPASRKKKGSESDSDEDWKSPKAKPKKSAASGGAKPKGKGTGFTRPYTLSPELAELMGAEALPRHEVVKKVWAIIKERNLYDPKNKQYAICDADLLKVMGVKRFRTFGMLKYLRSHFID